MFTVDRCLNDGPPSVPVLIQMNQVHALTICSFNIHFNATLLSTPTLLSCLRSSRFPTKTPHPSLFVPHVPRPFHPPLFYRPNNTLQALQIM